MPKETPKKSAAYTFHFHGSVPFYAGESLKYKTIGLRSLQSLSSLIVKIPWAVA